MDQRTGRLERAVALVEDGHTGVLVKRGTEDRQHPLSQRFIVPIDRIQVKSPTQETQNGATTIDVGMIPDQTTWQYQGIGSITLPGFSGTFGYLTIEGGYSEGGYGVSGYSGASADNLEVVY